MTLANPDRGLTTVKDKSRLSGQGNIMIRKSPINLHHHRMGPKKAMGPKTAAFLDQATQKRPGTVSSRVTVTVPAAVFLSIEQRLKALEEHVGRLEARTRRAGQGLAE